ncbi:rhodanese-like domain-containing protein [Georhizobium sp. MAB10]|uniref:rhodanese-like domain-containing protein n=1 Tax=Georhizobium sp. MAB10 TaxID=3028319 RepID=UPI00385572D0
MRSGTVKRLGAEEARRQIHGPGEIAFLDVREAGQFGEGHALFAIPCAYSRLEARVPDLVPRHTAPIVIVDDGDGIAERAGARLMDMGYSDVALIEGGMPAWAAAGFPVYKGVNVPSKVLGEIAEDVWHPKMLKPEDLAAWKAEDRPFRFYDARPPVEYAKMRVPGAECLPNGELAHRLPAIAEGKTPIVITCAGRTRGIIGAIGVMLVGHAGPVMALENGTQGWALSGGKLERGNSAAPYPELTDAQREKSRETAMALAGTYGLEIADPVRVEALLAEPEATTYLLDVRSTEEAKADPISGSVHALSGQLVQATDQWVAVRNARIILLDDGGMRAALAAFWLHQLGYEPYICLLDEAMRATLKRLNSLEAFKARPKSPKPPPLTTIDPVRARYCVALGEAILVDMRGSLDYRKAHVEGARWLVRPRAERLATALAGKSAYLVADDIQAAAWAAEDLRKAGVKDVSVIEGGHAALVKAGASVVGTPDEPSDADAIDHLFFVHDRHDDNLEASRRYLAWETGLIAQMDDVEKAAYRITSPNA